jgi:hypothetical protein
MNQEKVYQTIAFFNSDILAFPPYVAAFDEVESILALYRKTGIAQNLFIAGESGSGKTTLCKAIVHRYPERRLPERDVIPVLHVPIPTPATITSLAEAILTGLHDPAPMVGKLTEKSRRISVLVKALGVELILFDESQGIQERGRSYTQYMAADWLKQRLDQIDVPTVFFGLPHFEKLLHANAQLRRRFSRRRSLQIASDEHSDIEKECLQMFVSLGTSLPIRLSAAPYTWDDLGARIYYACDGRVGYIKKLLMSAIRAAMERGCSEINPAILEEVFAKEIWWEGIGALNPFNAKFTYRRLDRGQEPFAPTFVDTGDSRRRR